MSSEGSTVSHRGSATAPAHRQGRLFLSSTSLPTLAAVHHVGGKDDTFLKFEGNNYLYSEHTCKVPVPEIGPQLEPTLPIGQSVL